MNTNELKLKFDNTKDGPTMIIPIVDHFLLVNPDGSTKEVNFDEATIYTIGEYVNPFRKEHGFGDNKKK